MNGLILTFWAVAALMGCWSFSLLVRSVSEIIARKRVHLTARRSGKSIVLALVLMLVCAGVSVFAGLIALQIERTAGGGSRLVTPLNAIGGATCLFAACLIAWAGIGDRARGRLRCPKCWYDMSGAVGLQCPECGKSVKHVKLFTRAKRPKWAFVVAILLFLSGWYSFSTNKMYAEFGYFSLVPTWFLMLGWEHLPNSWVYDDGFTPFSGCLTDRLDENWTSDARLARFRAKLVRPMESSKEERWDTKRLFILDEINFSDDFESKLHPIANADKIFLGTATDVFEAITASNPSPLDNTIILLAPSTWDSFGRYFGASTWFLESHGFDEYDPDITNKAKRVQLTSALFRSLRERMNRVNISELLLHDNEDVANCALMIGFDTGLMDEHVFDYFEISHSPTPRRLRSRSIIIAGVMPDLSLESQNGVFDKINEWILDENPEKQNLALVALYMTQRYMEINDSSTNYAYQRVMHDVIEYSSRDTIILYEDDALSQSTRKNAARAISVYDQRGTIAFPLIRDILLTECDAPYTQAYSSPYIFGEQKSRLWLNYFADFANSPNLDVREWVLQNIPLWTPESPQSEVELSTNEQLNLLAAQFLNDPDKDIAELAELILENRHAENLFAKSDD